MLLKTLGTAELLDDSASRIVCDRRELIVLAWLAMQRRGRVIQREEIATLFWGSRDLARALHSTREAVRRLRLWVGSPMVLTRRTVALRPGYVELDVSLLEEDVAEGRLQQAVERWEGTFLHKAEDAGNDDFRFWLEGERQRLRTIVTRAVRRLAFEATWRGDWRAALRWSDRWLEISPYDDCAAHAHAVAMSHVGSGVAASAFLDQFLRHCAHDGDDTPADALVTLRRELGALPLASAVRSDRADHEPVNVHAGTATAEHVAGGARTVPVTVVVDRPQAFGDPSAHLTAAMIFELLVTSLGHKPNLVVAPRQRHRRAGNWWRDVRRIQRASGRTVVIEGSLYVTPEGVTRLDLRLVRVPEGTVVATSALRVANVFSVAERAAAWVAVNALHADPPAAARSG